MADPLQELLLRRIRADGAITVAEFMALALGHPQHGYYATRDPLGVAGDFVTAPEVSQMFGELIGLWAAVVWRSIGAPGRFRLVELGPGRGTLMADALRAARAVPAFEAAAELHLVETSPALRRVQAATLAAHEPRWHDDIGMVPDGPAIIVANEFLDALPIRQVERTADGWHERLVGLERDGLPCAGDGAGDGALAFALDPSPSPLSALIEPPIDRALPGAVVEISPPTHAVVEAIASRVAREGGAALLVDYGYGTPTGRPTLQAIRGHAPVDPLDRPGTADLTVHVDFAAVARVAREAGAAVHGPVEQGAFLSALGIHARAERLAAAAGAEVVAAALARLIGPGEMGTLFKVLAIGRAGDPVPPGFPEPRSEAAEGREA